MGLPIRLTNLRDINPSMELMASKLAILLLPKSTIRSLSDCKFIYLERFCSLNVRDSTWFPKQWISSRLRRDFRPERLLIEL